mgnify:CR=1 FL=1|tara:strand:- start:582 stop:737 length:156 start_codon:yes stop_codon:yes gene_type:complete
MKFRNFLDEQIKQGKISWDSRSEIIRASGSPQSGYTVSLKLVKKSIEENRR